MKKILLGALILFLPVIGYFSYSLINPVEKCGGKKGSSSEKLAIAKKLYSFNVKNETADLITCVDKIKKSLSDDRQFMLDFFVDNARSSATVRKSAGRYSALFGLSAASFSDEKGYRFSSTGTSNGSKPGLVVTETGLEISAKGELKEGGGKISLFISKEIPFSELKTLAELIGVELLILNGQKVVYTTFSEEIKNFGPKEDGTAILNDKIYNEDHSSITDSVVLYCLNKSGE